MDLFDVSVDPEFVADEEVAGFAINSEAPVSHLQVDQYMRAAQRVAELAAEAHADAWLACGAEDATCVDAFVEEVGLRVHRRPLDAEQRELYQALFALGVSDGSTTQAVALVLETMLAAPQFLYHVEMADPSDTDANLAAVDAFTLASRLSFFLWNAGPDDELLSLAASGALSTPDELEAQIERMLVSEKSARGLGTFYARWLGVHELPEKFKNADVYPDWDDETAMSAHDSAVAFATDVTLAGDGLSELLTANWAYANASLSSFYGAGSGAALERVELQGEERAGVMTQLGFLASHAHADTPSVVHRGLFVRERLLCQVLPEPPDDIDFDEIVNPGRLTDPQCSGCHRLMDPIGSAFGNFGATGELVEGGASAGEIVDALDSDLNGAYQSPLEMSQRASQSALVKECFSTQWLRYALARSIQSADACTAYAIAKDASTASGDIRAMLRAIALHPAFRHMKLG